MAPLGLTLVLLSLLAEGDASPRQDASSIEHGWLSCGFASLYVLQHWMGGALNLEQLRAADHGPISMLELITVAGQSGIVLHGVKLSAGDFPLREPHILHFSRGPVGHFMVARPVGQTGRLIQLFDPPSNYLFVYQDDLLNDPTFSGYALRPVTWRRRVVEWSKHIMVFSVGAGAVAAWIILRGQKFAKLCRSGSA